MPARRQPPKTSIVSDVESQVRARVEELRPLVEEYEQLQEVLATFQRARATTRTGARLGSTPSRAKRETAGPTGRGALAQQALELVHARPGISVPELAAEPGIGTTYLYRVMPALERDAKVRKEGTGYVAADA